jgi:hypothetical protein
VTIEHNSTMEERTKITQQDASRIVTIVWRLVASIPPLVGSLWATDLSFYLLLAGLVGSYVAIFCHPFFDYKLFKLDRESAVYSGWYSWTRWAYPTLAFAATALVVNLIQILVQDAWEAMKNRHPV